MATECVHSEGQAPRPASPSGKPTVSEQLREALRAHGDFYGLGKAVEIDVGLLYRFAKGQRGVSLKTFDRLARALGMRLVQDERLHS